MWRIVASSPQGFNATPACPAKRHLPRRSTTPNATKRWVVEVGGTWMVSSLGLRALRPWPAAFELVFLPPRRDSHRRSLGAGYNLESGFCRAPFPRYHFEQTRTKGQLASKRLFPGGGLKLETPGLWPISLEPATQRRVECGKVRRRPLVQLTTKWDFAPSFVHSRRAARAQWPHRPVTDLRAGSSEDSAAAAKKKNYLAWLTD